MAKSMAALWVVRSVLPRALYLDMARLTTRKLVRRRRGGMRSARTIRPMVPARSAAASASAMAVGRTRPPRTSITSDRDAAEARQPVAVVEPGQDGELRGPAPGTPDTQPSRLASALGLAPLCHCLRTRPAPGKPASGYWKWAKTLLELNTSVSTNSLRLSSSPSSDIAPTRQNQLSISCCPAWTISRVVVLVQVA